MKSLYVYSAFFIGLFSREIAARSLFLWFFALYINGQVTIDRHPVRFFVHKRPHVDFFLSVVGFQVKIQLAKWKSCLYNTKIYRSGIPVVWACSVHCQHGNIWHRRCRQAGRQPGHAEQEVKLLSIQFFKSCSSPLPGTTDSTARWTSAPTPRTCPPSVLIFPLFSFWIILRERTGHILVSLIDVQLSMSCKRSPLQFRFCRQCDSHQVLVQRSKWHCPAQSLASPWRTQVKRDKNKSSAIVCMGYDPYFLASSWQCFFFLGSPQTSAPYWTEIVKLRGSGM